MSVANILNTSHTFRTILDAFIEDIPNPDMIYVSSIYCSSIVGDVSQFPLTSTMNINLSSINGVQFPTGVFIPAYGSFFNTATTSNLGSNVASPTFYNLSSVSRNCSVGPGNSTIQVAIGGDYWITTSIQLDQMQGGQGNCYFWLTKNGSNVANTASWITVNAQQGEILANCEYMETLSAGDNVGIEFASPVASMVALAVPAAPPVPAIPSIITNISRVG